MSKNQIDSKVHYSNEKSVFNLEVYINEEWWKKKKGKTRKRKKDNDHYTFWDFVLDVLFWIPELLFFPLRLIYWLIKGIGRLIGNIVDLI